MITTELNDLVNRIIKNNNDVVYNPKLNMSKFENKRRIYDQFGEKFILDFGYVEIGLSEEERINAFTSYTNQALNDTSDEAKNYGAFLIDNGIEAFFLNKNTVAHESVPLGSKLTKAATTFITSPNSKLKLNFFQNKYSEILSKSRVAGNFYLSIHPLDFLSMSHNTYRWRSCHALNGDYASGSLALMLDKSTIVAYIAPEEHAKVFNQEEWTNKKWRALVHLSDDNEAFIISKHYPFALANMDILIQESMSSIFNREYKHTDNKLNIKTNQIADVAFIDARRAGDKARFITDRENEETVIYIAENVNCLHCNHETSYIEQSFEMACADCKTEEEYDCYCDNCGDGLYESEAYFTNVSCRCEYCHGEFTAYCESCSESVEMHDYNTEQECCVNCAEQEEPPKEPEEVDEK